MVKKISQNIALKVGKHLSSIDMETVKIIMTTAAATYEVEEAQRLNTAEFVGFTTKVRLRLKDLKPDKVILGTSNHIPEVALVVLLLS